MKPKSMPKVAKPLIDEDNPEWRASDFAKAKRFADLPAGLQKILSTRKRGLQKTPKKVALSIRLSQDVVSAFRSSGSGWQSRIDEVLRQNLPAGVGGVSAKNRG